MLSIFIQHSSMLAISYLQNVLVGKSNMEAWWEACNNHSYTKKGNCSPVSNEHFGLQCFWAWLGWSWLSSSSHFWHETNIIMIHSQLFLNIFCSVTLLFICFSFVLFFVFIVFSKCYILMSHQYLLYSSIKTTTNAQMIYICHAHRTFLKSSPLQFT